VDDESGVLTILTTSRGRHAVAGGDYGSAIRLVRRGLGLHQNDLAARSGYSQSTISRLEHNQLVDVVVLRDVCEALGIPPHIFRSVPSEPRSQGSTLENMERRALLKATLGVASAAMLPIELSDPTQGRKVGIGVVKESWATLERLRDLGQTHGGGVVYELTASMASRLKNTLASAHYSAAVGRGLRQVSAATMMCASRHASDAGRPEVGRQWCLEVLHLSDTSEGSAEWRISALQSLAFEAAQSPDRGGEVVELAQSASKTPGASPAMLSLVAARESLGHAVLGDEASSAAALARADRFLDQTNFDEEPQWLHFLGPAELACHRMIAAHHAGDGVAAVQAAQQAVDLDDQGRWPLKHALYQAFLGNSLARVGRYDEAIEVTREALINPAQKGSQRLTKELRSSEQLLARSPSAPARDFASMIDRLLLPPR
jgi:transcriptional regulator with XRE-family HTH domain